MVFKFAPQNKEGSSIFSTDKTDRIESDAKFPNTFYIILEYKQKLDHTSL